MGTDKRARQKANRAARIEAAYEQQRKEEGRKRGLNVVVVLAVLAALVGVYLFATRDSDDEQVASGDSSTTSAAPAATTSGPCYDLATGAEGAPDLGLPTTEKLTELQTEDLVVGEGEPVPAGATVTVDYVGFANSTATQFDDSFSRGTPATFPLTGVIPGWTEGIPGMQVGGSRLLRIPAAQAYGETGSPPDIGPNEDLTFCVTMVSFEGADGASTTTAAPGSTPASVPAPGPGATITGETPCPPAEGAERTTSFEQAPPTCLEAGKAYTATFQTNKGTIVVALDTERTPDTANNFAVLSRYGYYDGTAIFRTEPSIDIIQGGSPTTNTAADPGPGYTIEDEGGEFDFSTDQGKGPFTYQEGQLVMARSSGPNAAGAQFFFTAGPNAANLDSIGTYVVFGDVTEGLDVVQQILALHVPCAGDDPVCNGGGPSEPVVVEKVTIAEA